MRTVDIKYSFILIAFACFFVAFIVGCSRYSQPDETAKQRALVNRSFENPCDIMDEVAIISISWKNNLGWAGSAEYFHASVSDTLVSFEKYQDSSRDKNVIKFSDNNVASAILDSFKIDEICNLPLNHNGVVDCSHCNFFELTLRDNNGKEVTFSYEYANAPKMILRKVNYLKFVSDSL
jgi:hypothetical protein